MLSTLSKRWQRVPSENLLLLEQKKKEEIIVNGENLKEEAKVDSENIAGTTQKELDSAKMRKDLQDLQWEELLQIREQSMAGARCMDRQHEESWGMIL